MKSVNEEYKKTINTWESMEKETLIKEEENIKKHHFRCLNNSMELSCDINDEVYFTLGTDVKKGRIVSVNHAGMYWIQFLPDLDGSLICISCTELFKNVYFALMKSKYNFIKNTMNKENRKVRQ